MLSLPGAPVSDLDAFGILCRNLVKNALRHGDNRALIEVRMSANGTLIVTNDGPALPPDIMAHLTDRFERREETGDGSGFGLAIVKAIAQGAEAALALRSPVPGQTRGFTAAFHLPK